MLRKMRNDFKKYSWTLWVVIITFLVGFSLTDAFRSNQGSETDLFSIDGHKITGDEYQAQLLKTLELYGKQTKNKMTRQMINQLRIPEQVLQNMISTTIIKKEADKYSINVSDGELAEKISNYTVPMNDKEKGQIQVYIFRENGQKDGRFIGLDNYEALLQNNRIEVKDFEEEQRRAVLLSKFMDIVSSGLVIDPSTLREKYRSEKDQVELDYILLKTDRVKDKIESTEEELKKFYQENTQEFKSPEKRKGTVIALKFDDFKKEVEIKDQELFQYFKTNKEQFVIPERTKVSRIFLEYNDKNKEEITKKAETLRNELTAENFAAKAKEVSQDEKAKEGGDYGYWAWKSLTSQETSVVEEMKDKEISSPVDTAKGFALLMITEKTEQGQEPFDNVKARIRDTLERAKLEDIVGKKIAKIYAELKDAKNLKAEAEKKKTAFVETEALAGGEAVKDIDDMGYISRKFFTMKKDEIAYPVEFMKGLAIIRLTDVVKPQPEPFEKVKDKVKAKLEESKKLDKLEAEANLIVKKLNTLTKQEDIDKYLKTKELSTSPTTYRRGNKLAFLAQKKDLDETIFALELNKYSPPLRFDREIAIVKAKSNKITTDSQYEVEKTAFYNQKIGELKSTFFTAYLESARKTHEMDFFNQALFEKIKEAIVTRFRD